MRIFFLLTVLLAVIVGWSAGRPSDAPPAKAVVAPAPAPIPQSPNGWPGTVAIVRGADGHFMAAGTVNGSPLTFVVDTGASGVALSRADAARAGINVSDADFTAEARTAGGMIRVAPVRLAQVGVGTIQLADVPGVILDVAEAMPLLGQSFLGRLDTVSIERDRMTLTRR
jgi:aspartyl protease family protein